MEVVVIGGGAAGISAAIWANRLGLATLLVEGADRLGGILNYTYNRHIDCPGFYNYTGPEIARALTDQLVDSGVDYRLNSRVTQFSARKHLSVTLGTDEILTPKAVIFALGVHKRKLGIPGEQEFINKGVSFCAARDKRLYNKKHVIVVGGGDGAFEDSLQLAELGNRVTLVHRSDQFRARLQYQRAVFQNPNIKVVKFGKLVEIIGDDGLKAVKLETFQPDSSPKLSIVEADAVFPVLGIAPDTSIVSGQLQLDSQGFIKADNTGATSSPGVWACGEITNPVLPSLTTAFAQGAVAAKSVCSFLHSQQQSSFLMPEFEKQMQISASETSEF